MRVLIVLPRQERATGNEVTASRHAAGLVRLGHQVRIERVTPGSSAQLRAALCAFVPDIVHLLHAYRSGRPWLEAGPGARPYVVTLTGTDINSGIDTRDEGPVIRTVLAGAGKILAPTPRIAEGLRALFPALAAKVACLPPGIVLGTALSPFLRSDLATPGTTLFLHPAGLRPVKGNRELLDLFAPLVAAGFPFVLLFCGPILDPVYSAGFFAALAASPWARYLGVIPPDAIPALLRQVDVVLNNSQSEGLSNALLEAAALGVPMLVRAIPGNMALVSDQVNGLIYDDPDSFARQARRLMEDPSLRERLSSPFPERYSPERETLALVGLYEDLLKSAAGREGLPSGLRLFR